MSLWKGDRSCRCATLYISGACASPEAAANTALASPAINSLMRVSRFLKSQRPRHLTERSVIQNDRPAQTQEADRA